MSEESVTKSEEYKSEELIVRKKTWGVMIEV